MKNNIALDPVQVRAYGTFTIPANLHIAGYGCVRKGEDIVDITAIPFALVNCINLAVPLPIEKPY